MFCKEQTGGIGLTPNRLLDTVLYLKVEERRNQLSRNVIKFPCRVVALHQILCVAEVLLGKVLQPFHRIRCIDVNLGTMHRHIEPVKSCCFLCVVRTEATATNKIVPDALTVESVGNGISANPHLRSGAVDDIDAELRTEVAVAAHLEFCEDAGA